MRLNIYTFYVAVLFLHFLPLFTSGNLRGAKAVKNENWSSSDNSLAENVETRKRKPVFNIPLSDNSYIDSKSDKIRKSIHNSTVSITSTKQPPESYINVSTLNPAFINCLHSSVEPGRFVRLSNGLVHVPEFEFSLNTSWYIIIHGVLFYCPEFHYPEDDLAKNKETAEAQSSESDYTVSRTDSNNTKERVRRSRDYLLSDITRIETSTTESNNTILEEGNATEDTNFSIYISDPCNVTLDSKKDEGRVRRSIHYEFDNMTTTPSNSEDTIDYSKLSPEFINCDVHIPVEPGCYEKLPNGSVYAPVYKRVFDNSNYIIRNEELIICPSFFPKHHEGKKFSESSEIVSFACTIISTICILLHVIMFVLVKKLRNLPGYCLFSLCIALVNAYICTFVQIHISDHTACTVLGMCLVYFFLASFFWMNVMAYDVWKSIRLATSKLRLNTGRPIMIQFARYSLYAWGTPLLIILLSIIVHHSVPEDSKYRLTFNLRNCWFTFKQALTLYFAGPLFSLIGMNVLFFGSSFFMISNAAMSTSNTAGSQGSSDLWSRLLLSLRLSSVMGFMWIFGIIAAAAKLQWMWHLYSAFSALQGVFIFFSFSLNERTRKVCLKALMARKCSISPTQTSSQQATSISQKNENEQSV